MLAWVRVALFAGAFAVLVTAPEVAPASTWDPPVVVALCASVAVIAVAQRLTGRLEGVNAIPTVVAAVTLGPAPAVTVAGLSVFAGPASLGSAQRVLTFSVLAAASLVAEAADQFQDALTAPHAAFDPVHVALMVGLSAVTMWFVRLPTRKLAEYLAASTAGDRNGRGLISAFAAEQRRKQRLRALHDLAVAATVFEDGDEHGAARRLLNDLSGVIDCDWSIVLQPADPDGAQRVVASAGRAPGRPPEMPDDGHGECVRTGSLPDGTHFARTALLDRGELVGELLVARSKRPFVGGELRLLDVASLSISMVLRYAQRSSRDHEMAEAVQQVLLPVDLPAVPGISMAARYRPGEGGIGGDWYDAVELDGGRVGIVIGDVAGRGSEAAALMARLRGAACAHLADNGTPATCVAHVDRVVRKLHLGQMATMLVCVIDNHGATARVASAGHVTPILMRADGTSDTVAVQPGPPLGAGMAAREYDEHDLGFAAGDRLVLFTDGIVERRDTHIDESMLTLRRALRAAGGDGAPAGPQQLCDAAVASAAGPDGSGQHDDMAVLVVAREMLGDRLHIECESEPESISRVRAMLRTWLEQRDASPEDVFDLTVAVGEATTNAIEHAQSAFDSERFTVTAVVDGPHVTVQVHDRGRWREPRGVDRGRGVGYTLIRELSDRVHVDLGEDGTTVTIRRTLRRSEPAHTR